MMKMLYRVWLNNTYPGTLLYEGTNYVEACRVLEAGWSTRHMTKNEIRVPPASDMRGEVDS